MTTYDSYSNIDLVKTGRRLKWLVKRRRYSVRELQALLHLACPQPVYRWFKGQAMPSVDHLYALSRLLCVHMEDLLFPAEEEPEELIAKRRKYFRFLWERDKQLMHYWKRIQEAI